MSDQRFDLAALFPDLPHRRPTPSISALPHARPTPSVPWVAETDHPLPTGAVMIQDQHGDVIGWATDVGGHTDQATPPVGRDPARIAHHARLMAAAPEMAAALGMIATHGPCLLTILRAKGIAITTGLAAALRSAELVMRDMER